MNRLKSNIDNHDKKFLENKKLYLELLLDHNKILKQVHKGGSDKAVRRHLKIGKLLVRKRIKKLIDKDSDFLELSTLAAFGIKKDAFPSAGLVTGIGCIHGIDCVIIANDSTVKGGTYIKQGIQKHLRAQQIAQENNLPCVYMVDSGGVFLPDQHKVFGDRDHFGRFFYNQARMSAEGIPQIAIVMGGCTAGGAYVPAMADETIIVKKQGTIFIGGPPLVKAATGQEVSAEELGGAEMHTSISGTADHLADNDAHALKICRNIFESLQIKPLEQLQRVMPELPAYDPKEIYGIAPMDFRRPVNVIDIIARVVDGSKFQEFKARYGKTLVTGFAHIDGFPVGIIANNGVLFSESALKGAHFVELCTNRKIPLVFFQNIMGFMVGKEVEQGGIAKDLSLIHI